MQKTVSIFLIVSLIIVTNVFASEELNRAQQYIGKIETYIKNNPKILYYSENSPKIQNFVNILSGVDEKVALQAQEIISIKYDVQELGYKIQNPVLGIMPIEAKKYWVYGFIEGNLIYRWEKIYGNKEKILINKVLGIIKKDSLNSNMRRKYIAITWEFMNDINNLNIKFPDEHRADVMNPLIDIFKNQKNSIKLRIEAAKAWADNEKRVEIFYKNLDFIILNPELFNESALYLHYNQFANQNIVKDKMFKILESDKRFNMINGALNYLAQWAAYKPEEKKRLINKVKSLKENEKDEQIIKAYEKFLLDNNYGKR